MNSNKELIAMGREAAIYSCTSGLANAGEVFTKLTDALEAAERENEQLRANPLVQIDENGKVSFVDQSARIAELEAEVGRLRDFAEWFIREYCWDEVPDGGDIQDEAEQRGILIPHMDGLFYFAWSAKPLAPEVKDEDAV